MSPRRTRAATAGQSAVSTRSKRQKVNNADQDVAKSVQKVRQSHKKKSVKRNLEGEAAAKQSARKESPDTEVTFEKSARKRARRRLNLDKGAETEDVDRNVDSNKLIGILRDRYCDNVTVELVNYNLLQLNASKNLDLEKMPNGKLQRKTSTKTSPIIVTPKSTPPKLNLTPHRSKKTPKKSPISLSSPKTHSTDVPKLFKSPRKLSLATSEDSEENSEKSDSNSRSRKSQKSKKKSLKNGSTFDKSTSMSPTGKIKHKKSDINLKAVVRKFSKSPKIVLKSPKSKRSKSRKLKLLSPSQMRNNMLKTPSPSPTGAMTNLDNANSSRIRIKKSPLSEGKSLSSVKRRLLNSKLTKTLTALQMKDVLAEPIVLLEKLSPEYLKRKDMLIASKTQLNTSFKVRSSSIRAGSNSKILTPIKKAADMSAERNSSPKLRNNSVEKSQISNTNRISPRIKHNTSIPLMSSTPREEKMALINTSLASDTSVASVNNTSLNTRHKNQSNMQLSNVTNKSADIENVSEPSLFDKEINDTSQSLLLNVTKRNATYNKNNTMEKKQENNKDNTYELERPQTLSLQQMIKKRTSTDANLSLRDNAKKAKVRFADITSGRGTQNSLKLNRSQSSISHDVQNKSNIMNSTHKSKKVETPKLTQNLLISSFKRSSPRIHGGTPRAQLSKIQVTPLTFASIERKSEKKSSTKKVPNFGRIHEQMFAKSESLVDAKKRLEARHLAFTANKAVSKVNVKRGTEEKKLLPTDTRDGIHNRFGFKLKKPEATHIMLKKQTIFSRQKQQYETRMMLKGVRTNRRFELQMKTRNLNS